MEATDNLNDKCHSEYWWDIAELLDKNRDFFKEIECLKKALTLTIIEEEQKGD